MVNRGRINKELAINSKLPTAASKANAFRLRAPIFIFLCTTSVFSVLQIHKFFVFWQVFKQPKEPDQFGGTLKRLP
jgi:hypothetical protein